MKAPLLRLNHSYLILILANRSYLNQEIIETSNAQTSCQNQEDNLFSTISTSNHQSNDISYVFLQKFYLFPVLGHEN